MWCLSRPFTEPLFFTGPIAAVAAIPDLKAEHVVWFDAFDYERYNQGRLA